MATRTLGIVRLSQQEVETLEERHPELAAVTQAGGRQAITIAASASVLSLVEQLSERIAREEGQAAGVLEALAPDVEEGVISQDRLQQLWLQSRAKRAFVDSVELLTSAMIGELGGSSARNPSALASRWKAEGRIFAVSNKRADLFPVFQFDAHGHPRPVIAEVLRHFTNESDWGKALWWTSPSGWLGGRRPIDVLDEDPDAVVEAARRSAEPLEV